MYDRSAENGATICALVPVKVVTGQAESIKSLTITLVILAIIIASLIGIWIAAGIQGNMKRISKRFGEVAKVNHSTGELEHSAGGVKSASEIISGYSEDITRAISGINTGMEKQFTYA